MALNTYNGISPRTQAKAEKQLLKRADELMVLERFGQSKPLGPNETKSIVFRRYTALDNDPNNHILVEGVTPVGSTLTYEDYTATLEEFGDHVKITDTVLDTHEDPILRESVDLCGQQSAEMLEINRFNKIMGGTNVFYAGDVAARNQVKETFTLNLQRKVTTAMRIQRAKHHTRMVKSTPSYGTQPIQAAYIGVIPVEVENVLRDIPQFVPSEKYGTESPIPGEIGKIEAVRYIVSNLMPFYTGAGGAVGAGIQSTGGNADVYPMLILGQDAYGTVPFKGKNGVKVMVRNPSPQDGDELAQRGSVGWKARQTALILSEPWIARVEIAVPAL